MRLLLKVTRWPNHAKEYAARLKGLDTKFGFDREFVGVESRNWSRSGKGGTTTLLITEPGFYEISDPATGLYGADARYYASIAEDGTITKVEKEDVRLAFGGEPVTAVVSGRESVA